jgi:hypothetical protein
MILITHQRTASVKLMSLAHLYIKQRLEEELQEDITVLNLAEFFEFPVRFCMGEINRIVLDINQKTWPQTVEVFSLHPDLYNTYDTALERVKILQKEKRNTQQNSESKNVYGGDSLYKISPDGQKMFYMCVANKVTFESKSEGWKWLQQEFKNRIRFLKLISHARRIRAICKIHINGSHPRLAPLYKAIIDNFPCHFLYRRDIKAAVESCILKNQRLYNTKVGFKPSEPVKRNFESTPLDTILVGEKIDPSDPKIGTFKHTINIISLFSLMAYALNKNPNTQISCYEDVFFGDDPYNFIFDDSTRTHVPALLNLKELEQSQRDLGQRVEQPLVYEGSKDDFFTDVEYITKIVNTKIKQENAYCTTDELESLLEKLNVKR